VIQIVATTDSGARTASANFTFDVASPVLANPAEDGQLAPSATKLAVRGSNWGAGTAVTVWSTTPSALANARDLWQPPQDIPTVVLTADAAGQIVGNVPVPSTLLPLRPGALLGLAASALGPGYGQAITFLPTAYHVVLGELPTLLVSQLTAAQGDALRVSGDHWWPGDTVQLLYCGGAPKSANAAVRCNPAQSTTLGTAQVDATGHFAAHVTIPAQTATGAGTLEASVSGEYDDPFTATQALRVTASFNPGVWLTARLGPAAPLVALALLALAGVLAALWWIARQRPAQRAAQRG
jgi:hypothetical protein